jgi:hypothetical protein
MGTYELGIHPGGVDDREPGDEGHEHRTPLAIALTAAAASSRPQINA